MDLTPPPRWSLHAQEPEQSRSLARALGVSPLLAQLLINRGISTRETADLYLNSTLEALHNPFDLEDMDKATARLVRALREGEKIAVYGDYDVDGTTAAALFFDFFRDLGVFLEVYIPNRIKEGYSLNRGALDFLKSQGVRVVITVDNGIAAFECARYAREIGLDLIITDHHELMGELPAAIAVVNPKRPENRADFSGVAGVGVAFYVAMAVRKVLREDGRFAAGAKTTNLLKLLDLVALGTVADVAPLKGQNRILTKYGLQVMRKGARPGIACLCEVSRIPLESADAMDIAFRLGPRINAGGRIGEPKDGFYLLTAKSVDAARPYAGKLDSENSMRRKIEAGMLEEARALFESQGDLPERRACMVARRDWNVGVIGIVASRLVEAYHRPAIVFGWDGKRWKGSARSISGFPIHEAIGACSEHVIQFGGHPQAAGLSVEEERLQDFYAAFDAVTRARLSSDHCRKEIKIDYALTESLEKAHVEEFALLEPMGWGNREPVLVYEGLEVIATRHLSEGQHLKLTLKLTLGRGTSLFEAIAFRYPPRYRELLAEKRPISVAFRPGVNRWQGQERLQLQVLDMK